jgi:hypothetical protein
MNNNRLNREFVIKSRGKVICKGKSIDWGCFRTGFWGEWSCTVRSVIFCTPPQILLGRSNQGGWGGWDMWHALDRRGKCTRVLVGKPERKRPLERSRRRWEYGIRMDVTEIGWGSVEWIKLTQDRDRWRVLVNTVMNLRDLLSRS